MNLRRVASILAVVLYALAAAQLVPLIYCIAPSDPTSALGFAWGAGSCGLAGLVLRQYGDDVGELYRREGVLVVVGAWVLASIGGAIPYYASGAIPGAIDALFESASGFTTTGASILVDIEANSRSILFWRSMTQWLGGIGIVVLFVALLSELGPGARFLFSLEVPGPKAEILHARVRKTALVLFRIYLALTGVQIVLMLAFGTSLYDAITHAFATISTGGFSPHAASIGVFSPMVQLVVLLFMFAAGVNFTLHYALTQGRGGPAIRDVELRAYMVIAAVAILLIAIDLIADPDHARTDRGEVVLEAAFQTVSILTTTGFATADFAGWPATSQVILVALMLAGGCAGSTAGGAKIVRVLIGARAAAREVRLMFSPHSVIAISLGGTPIPEETVRGVVALLVLWFLGWGAGTLLLSIGDTPVLDAATASIATLSNIGPGLADVGPNGNFAFFAGWQKCTMIVLMWLGRLEFFALLALLQPAFWRR